MATRKVNSKELFGDSQSFSSKQVGSGGNLTGDEISIDASTVVNQNLMNEQNVVTPSEVYRNVPGMSR
jgi:hypothetical protein